MENLNSSAKRSFVDRTFSGGSSGHSPANKKPKDIASTSEESEEDAKDDRKFVPTNSTNPRKAKQA